MSNTVGFDLELTKTQAQDSLKSLAATAQSFSDNFVKSQKTMQDSLDQLSKKTKPVADGIKNNSDALKGFSGQLSAFDSLAGTSFSNAAGAVSGLSSQIAEVGLALAPVALLAGGLFAAFKFAQIGEENQKLMTNFKQFATGAGLDAESLVSRMEDVTAGFADLEEVLPKATSAVIALGKNANKLPEIFTAAKNIALSTGRDITETFESLTHAIETGSERQLRNNGIYITTDKIYENYAAKIHTTTDMLSEQGRQHAIVNAVLDQATKKFGSNTAAAAPMSEGIRKINLAFDEMKDAMAALINSKLGSWFASALSGVAGVAAVIADQFKLLGGDVGNTAAQVKRFEGAITALKETQKGNIYNPEVYKAYQNQIDSLQAKVDKLKQSKESVEKLGPSTAANQDLSKSSSVKGDIRDKTGKEIKEENDKVAAINADAALTAQKQAIESSEVLVEIQKGKFIAYQDLAQANLQKTLDLNKVEYEAEMKKIALMRDGKEKDALRNKALVTKTTADQKAEDNKQLTLIKSNNETKKKYDELSSDEKIANLSATFSTISALTSSNNSALFAIGKAASIATATIDGFAAVQKALASAPPPFNFVLAGIVGAASAINIGNIASSQPPKMAEGGISGHTGIMDGSSYSGDLITTQINSGELTINRKQQADLYSFIKGGAPSGNTQLSAQMATLINVLQDKNLNVNVAIAGKDITDAIRSESRKGRTY